MSKRNRVLKSLDEFDMFTIFKGGNIYSFIRFDSSTNEVFYMFCDIDGSSEILISKCPSIKVYFLF